MKSFLAHSCNSNAWPPGPFPKPTLPSSPTIQHMGTRHPSASLALPRETLMWARPAAACTALLLKTMTSTGTVVCSRGPMGCHLSPSSTCNRQEQEKA